jgi:hypothetical protein
MKTDLAGGTVILTVDNGKSPKDVGYQATTHSLTLEQYLKHARDPDFVAAVAPTDHTAVLSAIALDAAAKPAPK